MTKRYLIILLICALGVGLPTAVSQAINAPQPEVSSPTLVPETRPPDPHADDVGLPVAWRGQQNSLAYPGAGVVSYYNLGVFGQNICTAFGDPYSPANSLWAPGAYTYTYRIRIPATYSHDHLRVELFDPDSINASGNGPFTIPRTDAAISAGLPPTTSAGCTLDQRERCLINSGELALAHTGNLPLDVINPYFVWRVDENRGSGAPPGNGTCGVPGSYDPAYNTRTLFQLYYYQETISDTVVRAPLAQYLGQVGDGVRDTGDHLTDRHWVSPGAPASTDQPASVPADSGSFEIDLATLPDIITDPETGDRYLYLDVTALEGASKNGFDIWAGPPHYTATVPSEVNARNLHILNNPDSHSALQVEVEALEHLLITTHYSGTLPVPLTPLGPEYAGGQVNLTLFDTDAGATPPITFNLDSLAPADWGLVFGQPGVDDPDGVPAGSRCTPGSCNNQFISPPYALTLPTEVGCDYGNPDPQTCTPFYGGRLEASLAAGPGDMYMWQVTGLSQPTPPVDPGAGCTAFPIAIHEGVRSATPPGSGGTHPYPNQNDFDTGTATHQYVPPTYQQFIYHVADVPLLQADPGYIYRVWNGAGQGDFGWLRWNEGLLGSTQNLDGSMNWPGNSGNYYQYPDGHPDRPLGQPVPGSGYDWPVWGYIEPGDPTDQEMHLNDWVVGNTGVSNAGYLEETLVGHINAGRNLRLLIWDITNGQTGDDLAFHTSRFALFRLHGYNLTQGWILLEFLGFDESCGQLYSLNLSGPTVGETNIPYTFTAVITPPVPTLPLTYTWQADGQTTITHTGGYTDTAVFTWANSGLRTISVIASNGTTTLTQIHQIDILPDGPDLTVLGPPQLVTPLPLGAQQPVTFTATIANLGDADVTGQFFVDLFLDPTVVLSSGIPITQSSGFVALPGLAAGVSQVVTVTAPFGFNDTPPTHTVYIMVESLHEISETVETNNVSAPLTVTGVHPLLDGVTLSGPGVGLTGETYTFTAVVTPSTITDPITYAWFVDDTFMLSQTNGISASIPLSWPEAGPHDILVIADHGFNSVSDTHTITLSAAPAADLAVLGPPQLVTPPPLLPHQPVTFTATIANLGDADASGQFFVDLFLDPTVVLSSGIPITQSSGYIALSGLAAGISQVVTITAPFGFNNAPPTHTVYVMVDSLHQITESVETNNVSAPLTVSGVVRPLTAVSLSGPVTGTINTAYTFTATALPLTATVPVTYVWQATGQETITHTGGLTDTAVFTWPLTGAMTITVTAVNPAGTAVMAAHTLTLTAPPPPEPENRIYLPFIRRR